MRRMTLKEAQCRLDELPQAVTDDPLVITRRNKPVLVAMSCAHFDSLVETLDILSDRAFWLHLDKGIKDAMTGRTTASAKVRRRLGL